MNGRPSFSIVVPTFQRREVVRDAVNALCKVDYGGPLELIVVVDGSTDGTAEALQEIACPFPVRMIEQPNAGAARARNRGAQAASGNILLFLDDDMMAAADLVEQHARSHESGADAVLGHVPLDSASPPTFLANGAGRWAEERALHLQSGKPLGLFDLVTGQLSVRRSLFEELGGFDESFTAGGTFGDEDLDFGVRLLERARVEFNPHAVSHQRYVVTPSHCIQQWREAGRADVAFARKHPSHAKELFLLHGADRALHRLLWRPIARAAMLEKIFSAACTSLADRHDKLPNWLKRPAARLFYGARDAAYWAGVNTAGGIPDRDQVLVLCYHAIDDLSGDPVLADYGIARAEFAAQMDDLIARGFTFISPDELLALVEGKGKVPRKAVILTFDDCYEELAEVARSILRPRGIRGIAFAVSGMPSQTNEWDQAIGARRLRLLDGPGLQLLSSVGTEIGCHSRSHRQMPSLSDDELLQETSGAADDLAKLGLPRPRFMAYPHGRHDGRTREAVRAAGFAAAFGLASRRATLSSDRFDLPRVEILARDAGWRFRFKTTWPRLTRLLRIRSIVLRGANGTVRRLQRLLPLAS